MDHRLLCLLSLVLTAVACSDGVADSAMTARIDTVGVNRIEVTNTGVSIWTPGTAWQLQEDLRLGAAADASSEQEQFGSIASVVADSRGRIYVLDWMSQDVRVFHPTGAYSHTIGRRGRGPGEFSGAWELDIGLGDTLTVLDDGMMRFSVFAPDGTFVESRRRSIVGYGPPGRTLLQDGGYLDWALVFPNGRSGARIFFFPVRYAPGFEHADTFPPIEYTQDMVPSGRMPVMDFGAFVVASVDARGNVWFADSREYRVYRRHLEGDTTLVFSLPVEAVPLGETEREHVRTRWANRPEIGADQLAGLPDTKPVIYGIVPDNAGHVFVFPDIAGEPAGTVVDVFRESGEYLGRITLPTPVPLTPNRPPVVHATSEHLHVVVRDEIDVPYVSRLKIAKGR